MILMDMGFYKMVEMLWDHIHDIFISGDDNFSLAL